MPILHMLWNESDIQQEHLYITIASQVFLMKRWLSANLPPDSIFCHHLDDLHSKRTYDSLKTFSFLTSGTLFLCWPCFGDYGYLESEGYSSIPMASIPSLHLSRPLGSSWYFSLSSFELTKITAERWSGLDSCDYLSNQSLTREFYWI